jgi:hypothetical protein
MKYTLYLNRLVTDGISYTARLIQQKVTTYDEVIEKTTRRGIAITDTELIGAVNELTYTIIDELNMGHIVETPLGRFSLSICGPFESLDDSVDLDRHYVKVNCRKGDAIKIDPTKLTFEKVKQTVVAPFIDHVLDYSTMEENATITPGGAAEINGELLKIDTEDPEQGLFFIQNGTTTKVDVLIRNLPSDLIFNIPTSLVAGEYQLEIRNKIHKTDKTLKSTLFQHLLMVK